MADKILIVEDEKAISDIIAFNLKRDGYEVEYAYDGKEGLKLALDSSVDLVLLDVMLPEMNGFDVLSQLRKTSEVPVILVTAREEERDKILGLDTGADDYMTKPFSVKELLARIKANTRRKSVGFVAQTQCEYAFGNVKIDHSIKGVIKGDVPIELTQREYELIVYFSDAPMRVISREELMEKVWGYDYYGDLRAVDVAMRRLREKIEDDAGNPKYIMTKRGEGYYLSK